MRDLYSFLVTLQNPEPRRRVRTASKRFFILLLCFAVLLAAAFALHFDTIKKTYSQIRSEDYIRRAKKALDENKLTAARMMLQNAYRHAPERAEITDLFIQVLLRDGSPEALDLMLQKYRENPELTNTQRILKKAIEADKQALVYGLLPDFLSKFPDDFEVNRLCGVVFRDLGAMEQAQQCLERAKSLQPDNIPIKIELASLQLTHPDLTKSESARHFLEEIRSAGGDFGYLAIKALADDAWHKDFELAYSLYKDALAHRPDDWHSRLRLFKLSCRKDPANAVLEIPYIWDYSKNKLQKLQLLLAILAHLGGDEVLRWKNKLNNDELEDAGIRIVLIRALWDARRYNEAMALATKQTFLAPPVLERALLRYWTYRCHLALKDDATAERTLESLKNLVLEDPPTAILFSNELFAIGQQSMALTVLEDVAQGKNRGFSIAALERLFHYYKNNSDIEGLIRVHERMVKLFPENALVKSNLAVLLAYSHKDNARALILAESAHATLPDHPAVVSTYAQMLAINHKPQQALEILRKIDEKNFTQGMKLQRAHILHLSGLTEEAAESLRDLDTGEFLNQEIDLMEEILSAAKSQHSGR